MGFALQRNCDPDGYTRWSIHTWPLILATATAHGWEPAGTVDPEWPGCGGNWGGSYLTNHGQEVTATDAAAMAAALTAALQAAPMDIRADAESVSALVIRADSGEEALREFSQGIRAAFSRINALEASGYQGAADLQFIGHNRERVAEFVAFLRRGSFRIY